jgi:hypothetical protein
VSSQPKNLTEYAQAHERMWGKNTYPGRPALVDILKSPIVAFWIDSTSRDKQRHFVTLHADLKPIQDYFSTLVRRLPFGFPNRRLAILLKGREVRIKSVQVSFEVVKIPASPQ